MDSFNSRANAKCTDSYVKLYVPAAAAARSFLGGSVVVAVAVSAVAAHDASFCTSVVSFRLICLQPTS